MDAPSVMLYNRCQRQGCDGNLYAEVIEGVTELACLACGWRQELGHTPTTERPISGGGGEIKRWSRQK